MALPEGYVPYVTSARRYRWRRQIVAADAGDLGLAAVFFALRVGTYGTPLPPDLPARSLLLTAGVLALEEVRGAGVDELRSYGLSIAQAHALINRIETDEDLADMPTFQAGPNIGQEYETDPLTLYPSAVTAATGNGDSYELGDKGTLRLALDVTAISGTGASLHCQVQTRNSSADTWRTVEAFPIVSAVGVTYRTVPGCDRYVRTQHTLAGSTPSVTFSVSGNAV